MRSTFVILLQTVFLLGFMPTESNPTSKINLGDNTWLVTEMPNFDATPFSDRQKPKITFDLEENRFHGFAGCNRMFGSFEVHEDSLFIGNVAATRMMCEDMRVEDHFFRYFQQTKFKIAQIDSVLILEFDSGKFILKPTSLE